MADETKKASAKSKVEAILFSTGHRISLDEVSKLSRSRKEEVLQALQELRKEYDDKQSSLMLVEEGEHWKLTVRDHLIPIVRKIVTETELSRSVLETLAVIAFKYPILQSDLIKIRTNKAYDHLLELEKSGYITRQKHSRTNLIKLTEKFFKYFDLTEEKLKDQFKDFDSIAKAIKEKEEEVDKIKEEQQKKAEDLKKEDERIRKEIESLDKNEEDFEVPLEAYGEKPKGLISEEMLKQGNIILEKEKIGELEIVDEPKPKKKEIRKEEPQKEPVPDVAPQPIAQEVKIEEKHGVLQQKQEPQETKEHEPNHKQIFEEKKPETKKPRKKSEGIRINPEMESKVNQKVDEMLHGNDQEKK